MFKSVLRFTKTKQSERFLEDILKGAKYEFLKNRCLDYFEYTMCNNGYNVFEIETTNKITFELLKDYCNKKDFTYLIGKHSYSLLITGIKVKGV